MLVSPRTLASLLGLGLVVSSVQAARPWDDLLRRVPESANAIFLIDVKGMHESPLGVKENWAKKHEAEFLAGTMQIPPKATHVVLSAQLNERLRPVWEIGVGMMSVDIDMATVAKREQSSVVNVAGHRYVASARNAFFVELGPKTVAAYAPANRQEFSRWLRASDEAKDISIAPFLKNAAGKLDTRTQMVVALDLADMVDPVVARRIVESSKVFAGKDVDKDVMAKVLTRAQGLLLTVRIGDALVGSDRFKGTLRIEFTESIAPIKDQLKPFLSELIEEWGAAVADFKTWESRLEDKALILQGPLTGPGLRKILSLVMPPTPSFDPIEEPSPGMSEKDVQAKASLRYFKAVSSLINDLRKELLNTTNQATVAHWHETYARQIDALPVLNVDDDLLKWSAGVSMSFRALAGSLNGVALDTKNLEAQKQYNTIRIGPSYSYGGAGGFGGGSYGGGFNSGSTWHFDNYNEIKQKQGEAVKAGQKDRDAVWRTLEDETLAIRRRMTSKYQVEF